MNKYKAPLIITIILFLLINTAYFWEGMLGVSNLLCLLVFALCFIVLVVHLFFQLFLAIKEKLRDKSQLYLIGIMFMLLGLIFVRPFGVIDFEKFEGQDLLIATREGVANCTTTLKLKENNKFYMRSVCFGIDKVGGTYSVNKDTIRFKFFSVRNDDDRFKLAVLRRNKDKNGKIYYDFDLYKSVNDTVPFRLFVTKNNLFK